MKRIVINLSQDEKYPDYSMERVYGSSGEYHIGFFLYLMLLLAEKINDWYDDKLSRLIGDKILIDLETGWDSRFGEEEDRLFEIEVEKELLRTLGKEGMMKSGGCPSGALSDGPS